jgi:hypothetical protein
LTSRQGRKLQNFCRCNLHTGINKLECFDLENIFAQYCLLISTSESRNGWGAGRIVKGDDLDLCLRVRLGSRGGIHKTSDNNLTTVLYAVCLKLNKFSKILSA